MANKHLTNTNLSGGTDIWSIEKASTNFDALLEAAATRGPQKIRGDKREFMLSLLGTDDSPLGRKIFEQGGPLTPDIDLEG